MIFVLFYIYETILADLLHFFHTYIFFIFVIIFLIAKLAFKLRLKYVFKNFDINHFYA